MTNPQPPAPGGLPGPSGRLPDAQPPMQPPGPDRGPEGPGPGGLGSPRPELPQPDRPGQGPQLPSPGEHEPPGEYAPPGEQHADESPEQRPPHQQAPPPPPHRQGPQQDPSRPEPEVGAEPDPEIPEQVHTSRTLWLFTATMLVLAQLATLLPGAYRRTTEEYREILGSMAEQFTDEQIRQTATVAQVITVALVAIGAALIVVVATKMRGGRNWARALLTAVGIVIVVNGLAALLVLLTGGSGAMPNAAPIPQFATLAGSMLAGLFGAVALWQMYTEPAKKYFLERNGVPPRR